MSGHVSNDARGSMLNTVRKVGPVLDLFTPERSEWRMTEIAHELEMPKSSAHSLLATLVDIGLLSVTHRGRYRLGWNLLTLAQRLQPHLDSGILHPVMEELAETSGESVLVAVLDGHEVQYVDRLDAPQQTIQLGGIQVGGRLPAHCTAVGKVQLAALEPEGVGSLLRHVGMRRFTRLTITEVDELAESLGQVCHDGMAFDVGEFSLDVRCIAVPIRDPSGLVVAAMSVAIPAYRYEEAVERVIEPLQNASAAASARLALPAFP